MDNDKNCDTQDVRMTPGEPTPVFTARLPVQHVRFYMPIAFFVAMQTELES